MNEPISNLEAEILEDIGSSASVEVDELSDHQKQFLLVKSKDISRSNADIARSLGIKPDTVTRWKYGGETPFAKAFEALMVVTDEKVKAVAEWDREKFIDDELVDPALQRLGEILNLKISRYTDAAMIAQIRQAAVGVLHDRGILVDPERNPNQVTVIVEQHVAEGRKYKAPWKKVAQLASGVEVESPA
jgi:hypothetical protein